MVRLYNERAVYGIFHRERIYTFVSPVIFDAILSSSDPSDITDTGIFTGRFWYGFSNLVNSAA